MKIYSIYFILGRVLIYFQIKDISAKKKDLIYFGANGKMLAFELKVEFSEFRTQYTSFAFA